MALKNNTQYEINKNLIEYYDDLDYIKDFLIGDWKINAEINHNDCYVLREAFKRNDIEMIEFLLLNENLKEKANINYGKGSILRTIYSQGQIDLLRFVLLDTRLEENLDIYGDGDRLVELGLKSNNLEIVKFLLSDEMKEKIDHEKIKPYINLILLENNSFDILGWLWKNTQLEYFHYKNNNFLNKKHGISYNDKNIIWLIDYFIETNDQDSLNQFKLVLRKRLESDVYNSNDLGIKRIEAYALKELFQKKVKIKEDIDKEKLNKI